MGNLDDDERVAPRKDLTAHMLKQRYFAIMTHLVGAPSEMVPVIPDHLRYMVDLERRGVLFASGPFLGADDQVTGDGLTIVRVASQGEAEALATQDPLYQRGLRTFVVRPWQLNEGSFSVTLTFSDGQYRIA